MGISRRHWLIAAIALAFAAGSATAAEVIVRSDDEPAADPDAMSFTQAASFKAFPLYYAGDAFADLPLTAIHRRLDARPPSDPTALRRNFVSFKYGDCVPIGGGCPAPLEIQIWPACERNPAMYSLTPDPDGAGPLKPPPLPHESLTVRDVPSAFYEEGNRLELSTGTVTVVLFGTKGQQDLLTAAKALRGANLDVLPGSPLPPPASGAVSGLLQCS
jgi:hypothetical protein